MALREYKVVKTAPALADLDQIYDYLFTEVSQRTADRIILAIGSQIDTLRTLPERGSIPIQISIDVRMLIAQNYLVFYSIDGDEVTILRVLHPSRDVNKIMS